MSAKLIGYWLAICILSAVGAAYGARALDQQFGVRQKLGFAPQSTTPPLSTTPAKP
jgi:hypothetical protein